MEFTGDLTRRRLPGAVVDAVAVVLFVLRPPARLVPLLVPHPVAPVTTVNRGIRLRRDLIIRSLIARLADNLPITVLTTRLW